MFARFLERIAGLGCVHWFKITCGGQVAHVSERLNFLAMSSHVHRHDLESAVEIIERAKGVKVTRDGDVFTYRTPARGGRGVVVSTTCARGIVEIANGIRTMQFARDLGFSLSR